MDTVTGTLPMSIRGIDEPVVFILGAGFSRAFNEHVPLMPCFLEKHQHLLVEDRFQRVKTFIDKCGLDTATLNIEDLFTLAALPKPWLSAQDSLDFALLAEQLRQLIEVVIRDSFRPLPGHAAERLKYELKPGAEDALMKFARFLICHSNAHVITFNYDTLLENYLEQFGSLQNPGCRNDPREFHRAFSYGFFGLYQDTSGKYVNRNDPVGIFRDGAWEKIILVLKLHGSLNWFRRRTQSTATQPEDIFPEWCHRPERQLSEFAVHFEPTKFIVPPILDKATILNQPVVSLIWLRAAKLIEKAKHLVFIGYSFPTTDFYAEFLFRYYGQHKDVTVVSWTDPADESAKAAAKEFALKKRYRDVLGNHLSDDRFLFCGAAEYCGSHLRPDGV